MAEVTPLGDHPHVDPGDGRTECYLCGKFVRDVIHSCKGVPVTRAAEWRVRALIDAVRADERTRLVEALTQPKVVEAAARAIIASLPGRLPDAPVDADVPHWRGQATAALAAAAVHIKAEAPQEVDHG